jgi:hypothetical protein
MPRKGKVFKIVGRVIRRFTRHGIAGLRVEAWDKDLIFDDFIGSAITDERGTLSIEFTDSYFKELFLDQQPDLFFKVFRGDVLIKSTEDSVLWNVTAEQTHVVIEIELPTSKPPFVLDQQDLGKTGSALIAAHDEAGKYVKTHLTLALRDIIGRYIRRAPQPLQDEIAAKLDDIDLSAVQGNTIREFVRGLLGERQGAPEDSEKAAEIFLNSLPNDAAIGELLYLDQPVNTNPFLADIVKRSRNYSLLKLTRLRSDDDALLQLLGALDESPAAFNDVLRNWQSSGTIEAETLVDVRETMRLAQLTAGNIQLVQALKEKGVRSPESLVSYSKAEWLELLETHGVEPLNTDTGVPSRDEYARQLAESVGRAFPTQLLINRIASRFAALTSKSLAAINSLLKRYPQARFEKRRLTGVDLEMLPSRERAGLEQALTIVRRTLEVFPDLELESILNNRTLAPADRLATINARVGTLLTFLNDNPQLDLRQADFISGTYVKAGEIEPTEIDWDNLGDQDGPRIRKQVKTYQRLLRLHPNGEVAARLLAAGFVSARSIVEHGEPRFLQLWNGDEAEASTVFQNSRSILQRATLAGLNARESAATGPASQNAFFNNASGDLVAYFRSIAGFNELFALPTFCDCEHCKSMFGPAAYFVDLMRFVDLNITQPNQSVTPGLTLSGRRPDLWQIPLDCENANTLVRYLDIVNDVLEQRMRHSYQLSDPDATLFATHHPLDLPFNLPLARTRAYLGQLNKPLDEVFEAFGTAEGSIAMESLGISREEFQLITTRDPSDVNLWEIYGLPSPSPGTLFVPYTMWHDLVRVDTFMRQTGLTRKEVNLLLFQNLDADEVTRDVQRSFYINNAPPAGPVTFGATPPASLTIELVATDPADVHEEFRNLSNEKLDRVHRFVRLAHKLEWSFEDLDWGLRSIGKTASNADIDDDAIIRLAQMKKWQEQFRVPLDVLCSLWFGIKDIGRHNPSGDDPLDLFNRTFNNPALLTGGAPYNFQPLRFLNSDDPLDANRNWLLGALEITDEELRMLLPGSATIVALGRLPLATLYRASRLPKLLGMWLRDVIELVRLLGFNDIEQVNTFANLKQLFDAADWLRTTGFNVHELRALRSKTSNEFVSLSDPEVNVRLMCEDLARAIGQNVVLDTSLVTPGAVSENEARRLFDDLVANQFIVKADAADRQGRLTNLFRPDAPNFNLQPLRSPFDAAAEERRIIEVLRHYDPNQIVLNRLAQFFDASPVEVSAMIRATSYSLDDVTLFDLLTTRIADHAFVPSGLADFLAALRAFKLLLGHVDLQTAEIEHIIAQPLRYNLGDAANPDTISNLSLANVQRLQRFSELARSLADPGQLREFFDSGGRDAKIASLAGLLHGEIDQVRALVDAYWPIQPGLDDTRFADVDSVVRIKERLDLAKYFGVHVETVRFWASWNSGDWNRYQEIATSVLATLKAKYTAETWSRTIDRLDGQVAELRRDALASYVMSHERGHGILSRKDLYKYLLIDVEMTSCEHISRIAQAILSVQLYVQRCQMNLEENLDPQSVPVEQWKWMRNYRVWEVNRRVFLYPENYIEPELRDDKTPIFKELEEELLQGDVTALTVEKAYRNYLNKFVEVGNLEIVGSCHDPGTATLFLVGRTKTEPPLYYYRKYINEVTWTPWEKIEITIKADVVSPVFAFGRLFVFWVERQNGGTDEPGLRGVIKYSFSDFSGRWVQPQSMKRKLVNVRLVVEPEDRPPILLANIEKYSHSMVYPYEQEKFIRVWWHLGLSVGLGSAELSYDLREPLDFLNPVPHIRHPYWLLAVDRYRDASGDRVRIVEMDTWDIEAEHYYTASIMANIVDDDLVTQRANARVILGEASYSESQIKIVNNRYDLYIFDGGQEEFLAARRHNRQLELGQDPFGSPYRFHFERITTDTVHELSRRLFAGGVDGLLRLDSQILPELPFNRYAPNWPLVVPPVADLDFTSAYGQYFEEVFFHIPLLIATRLNANQRFEDAQSWFHYVFNPTIDKAESVVVPTDRYWRYLPFRNKSLPSFHEMLTAPAALEAYHDHPFQPHAIARLRISAYQKTVVMKYIDNLIDWAEARFAENRWESVTEATLLYLLAYEILGGQPPESLDACATPPTRNYQQLEDAYRTGSHIPEFWIEVENALPNHTPIRPQLDGSRIDQSPQADSLLYFCFPENDRLRDYWRRVEDGLYKIRHCLTLAGVKSERSLYDPPIDPMDLVRAAAGGRDISSVLTEVFRPVPHYRFTHLIEKARSLAAQVQQLGAALLGALEKQDAEQLALLRSTHERKILELTRTVREQQMEEAAQSHAALVESRLSAKTRVKHYQKLIAASYIPNEISYFSAADAAQVLELVASNLHIEASVARLVVLLPSGHDIGEALSYAATAPSEIAKHHNIMASVNSVKAGFLRRKEDWELQLQLAQHEIAQLDSQVEAARMRSEITASELKVHEKAMEQADQQDSFLRGKFTNRELYQWMTGRLAGIYFQSYRLAYDLAKAAEKAFQYERNTSDNFVHVGHWDSLKKGLLAGESLMLELNQLEKAFLETNNRKLEIEKTISLSRLADNGGVYPTALTALKETGACEFTLSNTLFELDYPGHYCRQIKTVALSIPAIVGPYQHLKATLTQSSNSTLLRPAQNAFLPPPAQSLPQDALELDLNSIQVRTGWRSPERIAISSGINDSGTFQLNFGDERYLPFEGTGVVSSWRLEIPRRTNVVDLGTVSDVLVHLKYTAQFSDDLRRFVETGLTSERGYTMIELRPEQSAGWHRFMNPLPGVGEHELRMTISTDLLPSNITSQAVNQIFLKLDLANVSLPLSDDLTLAVKPGQADAIAFVFKESTVMQAAPANGGAFGEWRIAIDRSKIPNELKRRGVDGAPLVESIQGTDHFLLDSDKVKNLVLVLSYVGLLRT